MSVGLKLTFLTTRVPNFAQGDFITIGVYTSFILYSFYKVSPYEASLIGFVLGGMSGIAIYILALRPLVKAGSSFLYQAVATFAVGVVFMGIFGIMTDYLILHGHQTAAFFVLTYVDFSYLGNQGIVYVSPVLLGVTALVLYAFLTKTKLGIGLRASVENPFLSETIGINVQRLQILSWFVSGGLSAVAGSLFILWAPGSVNLGPGFLLTIFAGSVLGGLTSIFGSLLGGLLVGALPVIVTTYLSGFVGTWILEYQVGIPLLIMSIALLVAPEGLPALRERLRTH
jgi:branched-chain amino acid transport system permease protein